MKLRLGSVAVDMSIAWLETIEAVTDGLWDVEEMLMSELLGAVII